MVVYTYIWYVYRGWCICIVCIWWYVCICIVEFRDNVVSSICCAFACSTNGSRLTCRCVACVTPVDGGLVIRCLVLCWGCRVGAVVIVWQLHAEVLLGFNGTTVGPLK